MYSELNISNARMNGEFLSHLSQVLLDSDEKKYSKSQILEKMEQVVEAYYCDDSSAVNLEKSSKLSDSKFTNNSLRFASNQDFARLSVLLPWSAASQCSQHVVGGQYNSRKRAAVHAIPDKLVTELNDKIDLNRMNVIESGCFEGIHSISMAIYGAKVYGFDVRIENVLKSMVRAWVHGQSSSTCFDLLNIENTSVSDFYLAAYPNLNVDLYHCRGVLYHLTNPYKYCCQVAALKPSFIYFHTQVASDEQADELLETSHGTYKVFNYREGGRVIPFAGVEDYAKWFTVSSLKSLMSELGYGNIILEKLKEERNGLRLKILLKRQ